MRKVLAVLTAAGLLAAAVASERSNQESDPNPAPNRPASGCTAPSCHHGIENIRDHSSGMMQSILDLGRQAKDPAGCVVCHGGDPSAADKETAHQGTPAFFSRNTGPQGYYPDPGSPWVNAHTCGSCHSDYVKTQWNSLMMTEAGKIQGTSWTFGSLQGYKHEWGNYDARNPADPGERRGTDAYRSYMENLARCEPNVFPEAMTSVPAAPLDPAALAEHPEQSVFTYIRSECERCHLGVRGHEKRGDYRGMGCSACHIPYGNEGLYEGKDPTIPRDRPRHLLNHSIQATREARVTIRGETYSGIPVETCTTCHNRGKRIGVTFQGLMESAYTAPFTEGGEGQPKLHTKHYIAMQEDVHYRAGMVCQDCHTSIDVHGDGFLAGTTLGQVQIECADCHGTPEAYPWELPLGFGDEFGDVPRSGPPRGVAARVYHGLSDGTRFASEDGYLLTARGNPFPEVVRRGNLVVVHTAAGKDIELKPVKLLRAEKELAIEPTVAMQSIGLHIEKMECYACHATWAPQCYGCHVKIDYSGGKRSFDWVAAGHQHARSGGS